MYHEFIIACPDIDGKRIHTCICFMSIFVDDGNNCLITMYSTRQGEIDRLESEGVIGFFCKKGYRLSTNEAFQFLQKNAYNEIVRVRNGVKTKRVHICRMSEHGIFKYEISLDTGNVIGHSKTAITMIDRPASYFILQKAYEYKEFICHEIVDNGTVFFKINKNFEVESLQNKNPS